MIINQNISSMYAQRQLGIFENKYKKNIERLSSAQKINSAKDDPLGLLVSEKMRSRIASSKMALQNTQLGINLLETAESSLNQTNDILQRIRELAIQSANGIYTQEDRKQISEEVQLLIDEINRISETANFNGIQLLSNKEKGATPNATPTNAGLNNETSPQETNINPEMNSTAGRKISVHIGPEMNQSVEIKMNEVSSLSLGLRKDNQNLINFENEESSNKAIGILDQAIYMVNSQKSKLGAQQKRMEYASEGIKTNIENITAAESSIRDTNVASEMTDYIKNKILAEVSLSVLVQSNLSKKSALSLFS